MKEKKIENAKITNVSISMRDHGCLTFTIYIDAAGWSCGIGQYVNGHGYLDAKYWDGNGSMAVAMMKIMDTVGVERWEDLPGKYIRVESGGWGSTITKIGNIIKDKWFDLKEFFETDNGEAVFVLDERPKKNKEEY